VFRARPAAQRGQGPEPRQCLHAVSGDEATAAPSDPVTYSHGQLTKIFQLN